MWTEANRARYARPTRRYESDLTDTEWAEIGLLIRRPGGAATSRRWISARL